MRAVALHDFGSGPALSELPTLEPAKDELLVRVRASSVNGIDVYSPARSTSCKRAHSR